MSTTVTRDRDPEAVRRILAALFLPMEEIDGGQAAAAGVASRTTWLEEVMGDD